MYRTQISPFVFCETVHIEVNRIKTLVNSELMYAKGLLEHIFIFCSFEKQKSNPFS